METTIKYNVEFWKLFNHSGVTMEPSAFSKFCMSYMKMDETLLDVCCGNGRDSIFFEKSGLQVTSFDYDTLDLEDKKSKFDQTIEFDNVYCRFVLHAVPEHLEDYILINANKVLKDKGKLCIEVRSDKGTIKHGIDNHYRRLINKDELITKLTNLNFKVIYKKESTGLSLYNKEDPMLIRIIAQKQGDIQTRGTRKDEKKTYCILNPFTSYYLLTTVKRIFDENDIPFFLVFGTLLGAYRDKRFISHDSDIDLALLDKYRNKVMWLINEGYFRIYGFLFIREWHKKSHLKALMYKTDYIDFWFFKKVNGRYRAGRYYTIEEYQIDDGLSTIKLYDHTFKTVHNIEEYLKRHYPTGWKQPIRNYHSKV